MSPLITVPGGWELVLIVIVIVMLFGARKLPELARGTGQALRIFKDETKGMREDDSTTETTREPGEIQPPRSTEQPRQGEQRNDGTTA